ncbi:MAG TPA: hypothetical protein VFI95_15265 [Terriglobales bacterium]|nr:hypothetical protein [Terriglobales bacterium]
MRRRGNGGAPLQDADVDLAFIKVGVTNRGEISTRLRDIDVDSPMTQVFWGRWVESSWGVVGGSLPPLSPSDMPAAGGARHWRYRNVLVKFNDQAIAVEQRRIDNEEILWQQLVAYMRNSDMPWKFETLQIPAFEKKHTYVTLSPGGLELKAPKEKDSVTITFPSPVMIRLRPRFRPQALSAPELTCFELEIADVGSGQGRAFHSCVDARKFMGILAYLDHLPPPARWQGKP